MSDSSLHTTELHAFLDRMRADDPAAREELLRSVSGRLERLARKMLRQFPGVARWEQADDVLQNAVVRLLRALQAVRPASVRAFFGLAATQMRRELIDLARHYQGPQGPGANHASAADLPAAQDTPTPALDPPEPIDEARDLEQWCAFHDAVEKLPAEEREVVSLVFYHGWTQAEIAALFQVTERTIRRYWQTASLKLAEALGGTLLADVGRQTGG
jgi:RNA polymerase sigma factor (sigma-70 family)